MKGMRILDWSLLSAFAMFTEGGHEHSLPSLRPATGACGRSS